MNRNVNYLKLFTSSWRNWNSLQNTKRVFLQIQNLPVHTGPRNNKYSLSKQRQASGLSITRFSLVLCQTRLNISTWWGLILHTRPNVSTWWCLVLHFRRGLVGDCTTWDRLEPRWPTVPVLHLWMTCFLWPVSLFTFPHVFIQICLYVNDLCQ